MPILHQRLERLAHDNLRRATADSQSGLPKNHINSSQLSLQ